MADRPYWDAELMRQDHHTPAVLAIGDSWFWYPIGQSLLDPINAAWDRRHCLYAIGENGAEVRDYVEGKFRNVVRDALKGYGAGLSAVLISGGGNDFAGWTDLRRLLKANCGGAADAAACFRPARVDELFSEIRRYYVSLIMQVQEKCPPGVKIVLHNYDYPSPDARGVIGDQRWLKTPMLDREVPDALMKLCVGHLIDRFTGVMESLAVADSGVVLVRSAGCLDAADWANELHPSPSGFAKLARERWAPVLSRVLP